MEIKIFRANRGEGKTKWLFERAAEAYAEGRELYYVGSDSSLYGLSNMWTVNMHSMCPIKKLDHRFMPDYTKKYCFLTDELVENMSSAGFWIHSVKSTNSMWYITMDKENFVN